MSYASSLAATCSLCSLFYCGLCVSCCDARSPYGHGIVTCISLYVGPDVDFGNGPRLWVDLLDGDPAIWKQWQEYLEDASILKVWHNYSFDRAVLSNHGVRCKGFGGDTMHMARLWNASLPSYSLENLSHDYLQHRKRPMKELFSKPKPKKNGELGLAVELPPVEEIQRDPISRPHWMDYSTFDTQSTWQLQQFLQQELLKIAWSDTKSLWDFYTL